MNRLKGALVALYRRWKFVEEDLATPTGSEAHSADPEPLRTRKWLSIPLYQWIEGLLALPLILGLASILTRILKAILRPLLRDAQIQVGTATSIGIAGYHQDCGRIAQFVAHFRPIERFNQFVRSRSA